jgi:PIN domain nuclease of toxin-antitoxin system
VRIWRLPHLHRDPFERLLVAQVLEENMLLLTTDPLIRAYPVTVWW